MLPAATSAGSNASGDASMKPSLPQINVPNGGGAIKGIEEKFGVNASNGTSSFSIPLPVTAARGVTPDLSLSYNSGSGNGIFGLGWKLDQPSIKRKTDDELPQYLDGTDSDTFVFSEAEDLVAVFKKDDEGNFIIDGNGEYTIEEKDSPGNTHSIRFYSPRIEGLFARIERWQEKTTGIIKWRMITRENVTTLFGWTAQARLFDPPNELKTCQWLPEFTFDDKGNCAQYIYKREDAKGIDPSLLHNKNRLQGSAIQYTNLYLSKILYGNKTPYKNFNDPVPDLTGYLFELVFDYGEYNTAAPFNEIQDWLFRPDAFSEYKSGFDIRTTRLCNRVLLFHRFDDSEYNGLVQSLHFGYDTSSAQDFTYLKTVTFTGHIKKPDGTYTAQSLPPFEFTYQLPEWNSEVKEVIPSALVHAPIGIDDQTYQFVDLFNEGLSGILTEQANGWYYKHNLGNGVFEQAKLVSPRPSFTTQGGSLQLLDLEANGTKQLVNYSTAPKGFFELDDDDNWQPFNPFIELPNINFSDPSVRMLDLNGDGRAEVAIVEDNVITWYESAGKAGFAAARKSLKTFDKEEGPNNVFRDEKQTIFLADMSGDGLTDIVRIRNGEVCYWPNLGYGQFGSKIGMDHSPLFDHPDSFNAAYIRLADIDGSGTADIIYLGRKKFSCWKNLSGNRFSTSPFEINAIPDVHNKTFFSATDLLGNGVGCLVWSNPLAKDQQAPLKYIDLMNGRKPHLLIAYKNNMGKEVQLEYTPSTRYYVEDRKNGRPWITKLHFPVHCLSRVTVADRITQHTMVSSYTYHHGYYDHAEREFRGFGKVEQTDTELFGHYTKGDGGMIVDAELQQEPVITKQWFHTGACLRNGKILNQYAHEYWYEEMIRAGFNTVHHEKPLTDAVIIAANGIPQQVINQLSAEEYQQALRACKSVLLRSEVFAHDAPQTGAQPAEIKKQLTPYTASGINYIIELLQPKGKNKHAVFIVKDRETINYHYERNIEDPRIAQTLNIKHDEYGNVLEAASVAYGRKQADTSLPAAAQTAQTKPYISYSLYNYTKDAIDINSNRLRLPAETKTYELKGVVKTGDYYSVDNFTDILSDVNSDTAFYHEINKPLNGLRPQKRLIEHLRTLYYKNDLTGTLALYELESKSIPYENYQLAYTAELLEDIFGTTNVAGAKIDDALMLLGKFDHNKDENDLADADWWMRTGISKYIEAGESFLDAQSRFYVPIAHIDAHDAKTTVKYYGSYFLMISETEDALANKSAVLRFNFRTLQPQRIIDPNDNITEILINELGMVKATAAFGKGDEADDLAGLQEYHSPVELGLIDDFLNAASSTQLVTTGKALLQHATAIFVYDFDRYMVSNGTLPVAAASVIREEHFKKNNDSPVQISFTYSNGSGQPVMKKVQAEPGIAKRVTVNADNTYSISIEDTSTQAPQQLRWIGNGRTVLNNKGNVVKQYQPYFSVTHQYEHFKELVETGLTPLFYYDPIGRNVKTLHPEGTLVATEFDAWQMAVRDQNDMVTDPQCTWYINRIGRLIDAELLSEGKDPEKEQAAAQRTAQHANTPPRYYLDAFARPVLMVENNGKDELNNDILIYTTTGLDIEGNKRTVTDDRENIVMQYKYDMLGNKVYQLSMDAGERWLLQNAAGNPFRTWDARNHEFIFEYDILQRPTIKRVKGGDGINPLEPATPDHIYEKAIYGEGVPNDKANNLRTRAFIMYDTAGKTVTPQFDLKGNALGIQRRFAANYKEMVEWSGADPDAKLEPETYTTTYVYDALNRITRQTSADASIYEPHYNESGSLNNVRVTQNGNPEWFVSNIDYNEKGERTKITYGNGVSTRYFYDEATFRLIRLQTKRANNDPLQNLYYTYDAVGNITHIEDKNIPDIFFNNQKISGTAEYTYDALYRLITATGREHAGQLNFGLEDNWNDLPFMQQYSQTDPFAWRTYTQQYTYDHTGNMLQTQHTASGGNWVRNYEYETISNRLKTTSVAANANNFPYNYQHHAQHGFITALPHLQVMRWNFRDELQAIAQQSVVNGTPETTYYVYDSDGERVRKITERAAAQGIDPLKKSQRLYIDGIEIYTEYDNTEAPTLVRTSYHVMDDKKEIAVIETRNDFDDGTPKRLVRYQLANHLGSAAIETDGSPNARVISYEEFHPFGTTSYQATDAAIMAARKRYRYTHMERDEESGLEYHGARYYMPWLGRWMAADPAGIDDGLNLYAYVHNCPTKLIDPGGLKGEKSYDEPGTRVYKTKEDAQKRLDEVNKEEAALRKKGDSKHRNKYYSIIPDKGGTGFRIRIQTEKLFIITVGESGDGEHNTGNNALLAAQTHGREIEANSFPGAPNFRKGIDTVRVVEITNVAGLAKAVAPGDVAYLAYFGHAGVTRDTSQGDDDDTPTVDRHGPGALFIGNGTGTGANLTSRGDSSDKPVTEIAKSSFTEDAQIRLFGCRAGLGHPPVAQQLATHLKKDVYAYKSSGGSLFTTDKDFGHSTRDFKDSDLDVKIKWNAKDVWLVPIGKPTGWTKFTAPPPPPKAPAKKPAQAPAKKPAKTPATRR